MRLFVADDLARGVRTEETISCSACEMPRPRAGSVPYGHALLCNDCASEYEIARVMDGTLSLGQYVRDKRYGDGDRYKVADGSCPEEARRAAPEPSASRVIVE